MESKWNKLLARQIRRHFGSADNLPEELNRFISDINNTYESFDEDTELLQNSIEISSQELRNAFDKQKHDAEEQKQILNRIKKAIYALNPSRNPTISQKETSNANSNYLFDSLLRLIEERNKAEELLKQKTEEIELQNEELNRSNAQLVAAKVHAEESDRLKSAFLANMSHEIRTPVNGILGFTELLREPGLKEEQQKDYLEVIAKSGERMLNLIGDIICISKVDSGQMEVTLSETNIYAQMEYVFALFLPEAEQKGLKFLNKTMLHPDETVIRTDREKVSAILIHMVKNAIKFTQVGFIEMGCRKKGPNLEFYVKDTGIGIRKEHKEFIFERFRQGSESLSRNYEGAGLGLSISKAYVEILGGKILVESEECKGSVFSFTIPFRRQGK